MSGVFRLDAATVASNQPKTAMLLIDGSVSGASLAHCLTAPLRLRDGSCVLLALQALWFRIGRRAQVLSCILMHTAPAASALTAVRACGSVQITRRSTPQ